MNKSSFYYTLTQVECPQCRAIVQAMEYGDDVMMDMDFVCQHCGYEEISTVKQLAGLNQDGMKGGNYAA